MVILKLVVHDLSKFMTAMKARKHLPWTIFILAMFFLYPKSAIGSILELLPSVHGQGMWFKYLTDDDRFNWNGSVGVDINLLRYGNYSVPLNAHIESIIENKHDITRFDPIFIRYHIESGIGFPLLNRQSLLLFHHRCHHDVDRGGASNLKWEMIEFKVIDKFIRNQIKNSGQGNRLKFLGNLYYEVSFGRYFHNLQNNYKWDFGLLLKVDLFDYRGVLFRLSPEIHVFTKGSGAIQSSLNTDYALGMESNISGESGLVVLFVQYERCNDVDYYNGLTKKWGKAGLKIKW